jgi:hypothetical protein
LEEASRRHLADDLAWCPQHSHRWEEELCFHQQGHIQIRRQGQFLEPAKGKRATNHPCRH